MNKKLFVVAALFVSLLSGCMFTSCLGGNEEESESLGQAYFTVDGDASQIILHQDGGGTVIPVMADINKPAEFVKNERYILQFKYRQMDVSEDGNTVTGAHILAGEVLRTLDPLTAAKAEETHVSDEDSIFSVNSITATWAYRGYLNVLAKAYYSIDKENKGIYPTYNLVYNPESDIQQDRIRFQLLYNRHTAKDNTVYTSTSTYESVTCFRLDQLAGIVPGSDTIEVTINTTGVDKPSVLKVSRTDLHRGNYK